MEATTTENSQTVTLNDLQSVLHKMDYYKLVAGFMAFDLSGKIQIFVSEPSFGGAYVTRADVLQFIASY